MTHVTIIKLIDRNRFDAVLMRRAFTNRAPGEDWGARQRDKYIADLREQGEDLLDIEYEATSLFLDNDTLVTHRYQRPE